MLLQKLWSYDYSCINRPKVPNPQYYNTNWIRKVIKLIVQLKVKKNSFLDIKKKSTEAKEEMKNSKRENPLIQSWVLL